MTKKKVTTEKLYVVGIGASAGGLETLQKLFDKIPEDTGMAFVVAQHLSPDFVSMMPELLGKHTKMPIYTAEDKMTIEPNCIYLNRHNKNLHIKGRQLYLLKMGPKHNLNLPIDIFFHTLGEEYKEKSIGIILSGRGSDGSRGIKTIKEAGGIVMVQEPESAQFDGMPNSAIATNTVDFLLPPEEMADILAKIPLEKLVFEKKQGAPDSNEMMFKVILDEIHTYSGIDFNQYKPSTIQRRLANRLKILNFDNLQKYQQYLRINKNEKELLKKDFLIGVTQFFKDVQAFLALRNSVIPAIYNSKKPTETIRIWSAGCSTGEEAYSLAILFDEYIRMQKLNVDFKIFATDAEPSHIQIASKGVYYINSITEIEKKYLEQYFIKSDDKIQIIKRIREKIVFSNHNLITDPPFIKMDLISCRNLLIYLDNKLQNKVIQTFLFSLNKFGYLFLGNSESLPESLKSNFLSVDIKWKIFQSTTEGKYVIQKQKLKELIQNKSYKRKYNAIPYSGSRFKEKLQTKIYQYLSKRYSPDTVLIDNNFEILFISGKAGELLSHSEGVFQTNLLDTLNREMATLIRNAVRKLDKEKRDITLKKTIVRKAEKAFSYDITLHKITDMSDLEGSCLIQFSPVKEITGEPVEIAQVNPDELTKQQINDLEEELQFTKTELQNAMEKLETSNEELYILNEELIVSNEELKSTNEELQSVNEELYTAITELQKKNTELQCVNDQVSNLLNSTDIGVLYLDGNLNILKFTPTFQMHFDLQESDIGRPIANFVSGFDEETRLGIINDAKKVMKTLRPIQKEIKSKKGKYFFKRIHPYLTSDGKVNGVIISFIDITEIKRNELKLTLLNHAVEQSTVSVMITDNNGKIIYVNPKFVEMTGYKIEEIKGKTPHILKSGLNTEKFYKKLWNTLLAGKDWAGDFQNKRKNGELFWQHSVITPILNSKNEITHFVAIQQDVTQNKKMLKELHAAKEIAEKSEERFNLAMKASTDGLYDLNLETNEVYYSPAWKKMIGYEEHKLKNDFSVWKNLTDQDSVNKIMGQTEKLLSKEIDRFAVEFKMKHKDGHWVDILSRGEAFFDDSGKAIRVVGTHTDITERKKAEKELIIAREKAEESERFKTAFLSNMSHEIRTPINIILGFSEILSRLVTDKIQQDYVSSILSSGKTLLGLINKILEKSKIDTGKLELKTEALDIRLFLADIENLFKQNAKDKGLNLITKIADDVPNVVLLDELRLKQIFINLVNNAIKFTDTGYIKISIQTIPGEKGIIDLVFSIEDSGIGINKQEQQKIFNAFIQGSDKDNRKYSATGLGLTITKQLVELMKGTISLKSQPNKGSKFIVRLSNVRVIEEEVIKDQIEESDFNSIKFEKAVVLNVDDVEDNIRVVEGFLRPFNFEFLRATDGKAALKVMKKRQPDIIFTDLVMPGMNGYEFIKKIRENPDFMNLPVIAITASLLGLKEKKLFSLGFDGIIPNPINSHILLKNLKNHIKYTEVRKLDEKETVPVVENIKLTPQAIDEIKTELVPLLLELKKIRPRVKVKEMTQLLIETGIKHKISSFEKLGEKLKLATEAYNFENEKVLINQLSGIVDSLIEGKN